MVNHRGLYGYFEDYENIRYGIESQWKYVAFREQFEIAIIIRDWVEKLPRW